MYDRPLFTCPVEVVDIIVSHIEERRDLLSLALTSKVFHSIIVPSSLDVIHIRCDPRRIDVWKWITSKPHLAMRTRTLELINEYTPEFWGKVIIPSFSQDFDYFLKQDAYEECVLSLAAAVMDMSHLRHFRWNDQLPIADAFQSLFISLGQRDDMDELYFGLVRMGNGNSFDVEIEEPWTPVKFPSLSPLGNLHNITTFCLTVCDVVWSEDESDLMQDLMMQFTKLKHLQLRFMENWLRFDFVVICQRAYWPSLVELSLEGYIGIFPEIPDDTFVESDHDYNARNADQFAAFLHNHPTLERLKFLTDKGCSGFIQPQTVPQLRSLVLNGYCSSAEAKLLGNWFPLDIARQIEYLECPVSAKCLPTLGAMTSLRVFFAIDMDLDIFERFVKTVTHIQHLHIPYCFWRTKHSATLGAHRFADTIVNSLFELEHLVHLEGYFVGNGRDLYKSQYLIKRIMEHERLLYIDSFTREQWDWLLKQAALKRDFDLHLLPCVTVPDIRQSGNFYIKNLEY